MNSKLVTLMPTSCVTFEYLPIDQHLTSTQFDTDLPSQTLVIRRLELMLLSIMG
jgi:hypothetical protein